MIETLLLLLAGALAFVFGWNNSAFLIGNMQAAGTVGVRGAILVSVVGLLVGTLVEGPTMLKSLDGSLTPSSPDVGLAATFALSIAFTVGLTLLRLPASFSGIMVGSFVGAATALGLPIDADQLLLIISFWFIAPLIAALAAFLVRRATSRIVAGLSLLKMDSFNRVAVVGSSLAVAFVLGANNVGLIAGTAVGGEANQGVPVAAVLAVLAVIGTIAFGKGSVSDTIGDRMLSLGPQGVFAVFAGSAITVVVATQLSVPMSIGQCVFGGMFGSAYSQRTTAINRRVASLSIGTWFVTPLIAFAFGFLLTPR